jgi:bla regulator protein blaR1
MGLANHLWQSTLFAGFAGLLTLAFRRNRAQIRYGLWLTASVKFLVPFSVLVMWGGHFGRHTVTAASSAGIPYVIEEIGQPFATEAQPAAVAAVRPSITSYIPAVLGAAWAIGFAILLSSWWRRWLKMRSALRTASPVHLPIGVRALTSPAFFEPGVFGIWRPVLLLPEGIAEQLTPAQFEAILRHELCHIRRHDNLATSIQMLVEALFWFHPLVWWLGARLMEERERTCDEEVLRMGSEPEAYAEGILKICELYLESALPCVAGVTGANLTKRIEAIMENRMVPRLSFVKKATLALAGIAAFAVPIIIGVTDGPRLRAQSAREATPKWEAVSIRPCDDGGSGKQGPDTRDPGGPPTSPGRVNMCTTVMGFIRTAYVMFANGRFHTDAFPIVGDPAWINSARYRVTAKAEGAPNDFVMQGPMLQAILEDRFKLKIHRETREIPVYALTVAKGDLKIQPLKEGDCTVADYGNPNPAPPTPEHPYCDYSMMGRKGSIRTGDFRGMTMARFAERFSLLDRPVIDKTGVAGLFNFHLEFGFDDSTPALRPSPSDEPGGGPSIFTAVQEQLGLKLEPAKGPGEFLVIDSVERPTEN